jgi:hypothetical protein
MKGCATQAQYLAKILNRSAETKVLSNLFMILSTPFLPFFHVGTTSFNTMSTRPPSKNKYFKKQSQRVGVATFSPDFPFIQSEIEITQNYQILKRQDTSIPHLLPKNFPITAWAINV